VGKFFEALKKSDEGNAIPTPLVITDAEMNADGEATSTINNGSNLHRVRPVLEKFAALEVDLGAPPMEIPPPAPPPFFGASHLHPTRVAQKLGGLPQPPVF